MRGRIKNIVNFSQAESLVFAGLFLAALAALTFYNFNRNSAPVNVQLNPAGVGETVYCVSGGEARAARGRGAGAWTCGGYVSKILVSLPEDSLPAVSGLRVEIGARVFNFSGRELTAFQRSGKFALPERGARRAAFEVPPAVRGESPPFSAGGLDGAINWAGRTGLLERTLLGVLTLLAAFLLTARAASRLGYPAALRERGLNEAERGALCAALLLAAGMLIQVLAPDSYFGRIIPVNPQLGAGGVIIETDVSGTEGSFYGAFDGTFSGAVFHSELGVTTGTLTVSLPRPARADLLRLAPQQALCDRMPRDFSLEGDDGDGNWEPLARFSGVTPGEFSPERLTSFPVPAERPYRRYRFNVTANNGAPYLTFSELSLEERRDARPEKLKLFLLCGLCVLALCYAGQAEKTLLRILPGGRAPVSAGKAFTAAAFTPLLLLVLLPAQLYLGNISDFHNTFLILFLSGLPAAAAVTGALWAAFLHFARSERDRAAFIALAAMTGALIWLQTSLWPWSGGELSGGALQLAPAPMKAQMQAALWAAGLLFALLAPGLSARFAAAAAVAVLAAQSAAVLVRLPGLGALEAGKGLRTNPAATFEFSSDRPNVAVIVLDTFQSDIFDDILEERDGRFLGELEGFTFFRNAISAFPLTKASVPHFLTGRPFDNTVRYQEYLKTAFRNNSLFKSAAMAGYGVAAKPLQYGILHIDRETIPDAVREFPPGRVFSELALLYDMVLFGAAPDWVKPAVYSNGRWFLSRAAAALSAIAEEDGELPIPPTTKAEDARFVNELLRRAKARPGPGTFKYFHLTGNHLPLDTDEQLRAEDMGFTRESWVRQGKGALLLLGEILKKMKSLGVYDNSLIFVFSDHGGGLPVKNSPFAAKHRSPLTSRSELIMARGVSMLLAKNAGGRGPLRVSDSAAALGDVPFTIARHLGWPGTYEGEDLFSLKPGFKRRRVFIRTNTPSALRDGKFLMFQKYEVTGHAWNADSWRPAGD